MKKITNPCHPNQQKRIFSEGINYFTTGKKSIWGKGDKDTIKILQNTAIKGKWLNLAAGDGRYNLDLLRKADFVVASDIDKSALSKLWHITPKKYRKKLKTKAFDITKKFPFKKNSFDGIFCAGTLHIFSKKVLKKTVQEINKVLKTEGKVMIDFATDIRRARLDKKPYKIKDEPLYRMNEAKKFLKSLFKKYKIKMYESRVPEEIYSKANPPYRFKCKYVFLVAEKK